jgi:hypothetical protein
VSIALVTTRGYGNGTLIGTISDVVTRGYTIGESAGVWTVEPNTATTWTEQVNETTIWTVEPNQIG